MDLAKIIQLLWALLVAALFSVRAANIGSASSVILMLCAAMFVIVAFACFGDYRWSWWVSVVAMAIPVILTLPMVCLNFFMFVTGHELYRDSPGTLLVVIMIAGIFNVAPAMYYTCLAFDRKQLWGILVPNAKDA